MSEDPIGILGDDTNMFRFVANSPESLVDPSGLKIYTKLERETALRHAGKSLDELVKSGELTTKERDLRFEVIKAALNHDMKFNSTEEPNPMYFRKGEDGKFYLIPRKVARGVHDRVYRKSDIGSNTGCKRAIQTLMLEGLAQLAKKLDREGELDAASADKTLEQLFPTGESADFHVFTSNEDGFAIKDLIPGDRVWMHNHMNTVTDPEGNEGSNVIYVGKAFNGLPLFVHMDTPNVETLVQLQTTVKAYSVVGDRKLQNYKFKERYCPLVPEILKK